MAKSTTRAWTLPILLGVLLTGASLRLFNVDWDSRQYLHPDERYITMVAQDLKWPRSWSEYFNVQSSSLSPYNYELSRNYLYGTLPLFVTKYAARLFHQDNTMRINLMGRRLSALVDTFSILLVFLIARRLFPLQNEKSTLLIALLAASFYALCVTAIQNAHFFTMESWLNFFTLLTFYLATGIRPVANAANKKQFVLLLILIGASLGLTLACKINGIFVAIPVFIALLSVFKTPLGAAHVGKFILRMSTWLALVGLCAYLVFRFVSPYTFAYSNWLSLIPNFFFITALKQQASAVKGEILFAPQYQWLLSRPLISPLYNLVVWGLGLPLGLTALVGFLQLAWSTFTQALSNRARQPAGVSRQPAGWRARFGIFNLDEALTAKLMLLSFVTVVFFYVGSRFVHSTRYLFPIVPFLCLSAAYIMSCILQRKPTLGRAVGVLVLILTGLYVVAFLYIYTRPTTRVAASDWIVRNISPRAELINETWDDPLPLGLYPGGQQYSGLMLDIYEADDENKLGKLYSALALGDYYIVSSPRAWKTMGRLPNRFPLIARFYQLLFAGQLGFTKVAEFTSHPQIFGIEIRDLDAEETFWVYDHPPVMIFKKTKMLSWKQFEKLFAGLSPVTPS